MTRPSGTSETGISFRLARASGMPMIVTASAMAVAMWASAREREREATNRRR